MSLADKINERSMPMYLWGRECHPTERVYTYADVENLLQDFKALAAKHDEVMRMMVEALQEFVDCREESRCIDDCVPDASERAWKSLVERMQKLEQVALSSLQAHKELQ